MEIIGAATAVWARRQDYVRFERGFWGGSAPPHKQILGSVGGWEAQTRRTVQQTLEQMRVGNSISSRQQTGEPLDLAAAVLPIIAAC